MAGAQETVVFNCVRIFDCVWEIETNVVGNIKCIVNVGNEMRKVNFSFKRNIYYYTIDLKGKENFFFF